MSGRLYDNFYFFFLQDCNDGWITVLKTGINGEEIYGRKKDFVDHLLSGSDIRFSLGDQGTYFTSIQSASLSGNEDVCVQALFHISKSGFNNFQSDAYWWFLLVCTTGHTHMSRWSVGAHIDRGQTKTSYPVTWFVRCVLLIYLQDNDKLLIWGS
jgi:hypothetical protein